MKKYCRFLLGARFFKNFIEQIKWMDACKKIHHTPRPNNNQKSTLVMAESTLRISVVSVKTKLVKTKLVKTTNPKMYARIM